MSRSSVLFISGLLVVAASLFFWTAAAVSAPEEGSPAQDFALKDTNGKIRTLREQRGKVVLVNFWATWCGPCRIELPGINNLHKKYGGDRFEVYAVNADNAQTVGGVPALVTAMGLNFPILFDTENRVVMNYTPQGVIPFTVIVDQNGDVRHVHPGYEPGVETVLDQEIKALLKPAEQSAADKKPTGAQK